MRNFKVKKADIIIAAAVLVAAAIVFLCINSFADPGKTVEVEQNGTVVAEFELGTDAVYEVKNDGKVTNTVEIKNGAARITSADCPDKICVHHREIKKSGESIICLPNKVVVSVSGGDKEVDGVAR